MPQHYGQNVSGINTNFDSNFQLNTIGAQLPQSQQAPIPMSTLPATTGTNHLPDVAKVAKVAKPMDVNAELANLQAIKASIPSANAGISQSIGTTVGGGAGALIAGPAGAIIGASAGGAIGSIVDGMLGDAAADKAMKKQNDARRKEVARLQMIQKDQTKREMILRQQGIAAGIKGERMTERDLIEQERSNGLSRLINEINKKSEFDQTLKNKFLATRR